MNINKISNTLFKHDGIIYSLFSFIILIIYYPILNNQFLDAWDDQWVVINYFTESGINLSNLWNIFSSYFHGQYSPLNECLYLILYTCFGYDPFYFHLSSMLLHIGNACIIYVVLKKLLEMSDRIKTDNTRLISFLTVLIFIVHPLNVESVAWLSASKVLLYTLFYFLAIYTFLKFLKKGKKKYYAYTLISFFCSFLSKEQAVTFPVCILLIIWFLKHDFSLKKTCRIVAPYFLLAFIFGIITILSQIDFGVGPLHPGNSYPFWQRCVFASYSVIEYLIKCLFPINLMYLYPFPNPPGSPLPMWFLIYPILLAIMVYCFWQYIKKIIPLTFGVAFFLIHIAIALHLFPLSRFAIIADRYTYIALIGINYIIAYYIIKIYNHFPKYKTVLLLFSISYILFLGINSNIRSRVWYNSDTLRKELNEILEKRPDYSMFK